MSLSVVGRGHARMSRAARITIGLGCAAGVVGFVWWEMQSSKPRLTAHRPQSGSYSTGRPLDAQPVALTAPLPVPKPLAPPTPPRPIVQAVPPPGVHPMSVWEDKDAAKITRAATRAPAARSAGSDQDVVTPGAAVSEYARDMQTTQFANTTPIQHRFHKPYTIKKGEKIKCLPDSPISSELPGPISCTVQEDVWSMDNHTVLLPRWTTINGSVEHGLGDGQGRLFIVWTDALTPKPDLLPIPLEAPSADEMGQPGVPGDVNDHIWRKLKATALVSLIEIAGNVATAAAESGRNNNYFGGIGGQGQSLAQMAFAHDLNIPTTLYRGPSQPITIVTNRYTDLVNFYRDRVIR